MPATNSPKQDVVPVRITAAMRLQLDELIALGFGNQADIIRIAVSQMHHREAEKTQDELKRLRAELAQANEMLALWEADPEGMQNY